MIRLALIAAAGLSLSALPAAAQSWSGTYDAGYRTGDGYSSYDAGYGERPYQGGYEQRSYNDGYRARRSNAVPANFD